jgi:hypothetical protein
MLSLDVVSCPPCIILSHYVLQTYYTTPLYSMPDLYLNAHLLQCTLNLFHVSCESCKLPSHSHGKCYGTTYVFAGAQQVNARPPCHGFLTWVPDSLLHNLSSTP